ncbi:hypothetical protein [Actinoplanes auranticolor]|uniref:Uncharacterized protein n=1 Tax=Actinoplanes auranticolor TaxID=47988 RepID=A0A919S8S9_9ACTN|nr:hypothetical protein [Actinoplanes auranticolor]GIM67145.1 hypothetical protein Aau02nite_26090 [Actinoplanes auranticolor]
MSRRSTYAPGPGIRQRGNLRPGPAVAPAYRRDLGSGAQAPAEISSLFFPPAVSLTALTVATVLSVVKPWGRIGRRNRPPRR